MTQRRSLYRAATLLLLTPLTLPACAGDDTDDTDDGAVPAGMMLEIESGMFPTRPRGTALHGNATGVHECDGPYDHYEEAIEGDDAQLHIVGISNPALDEGTGASRPVDVHLARPGSSILVLTANESATWNVTVGSEAALEKVIVSSHEPQEVNVPDGVPVERLDGDETGVYAANDWPSYRATDLAHLAEELTGRPMTSFRGCSYGGRFEIDEPDEIQPPHPQSSVTDPVPLAGCEALTAESTFCMFDSFEGLAMLGVDSGEICRGDGVGGFAFPNLGSSIGWQGSYVYACDFERGIARISVEDGTVDIAPIPCQATTSYGGGLLTLTDQSGRYPLASLVQFDTFEAAVRREPTRVFGLDPYTSRIAVQGDRAYFAWHASDTVQTAELADGAPIEDILLEDYEDWIDGLDATADGRLVIGTPQPDAGVSLFDAATGELESRLFSDPDPFAMISGIKCHWEGN